MGTGLVKVRITGTTEALATLRRESAHASLARGTSIRGFTPVRVPPVNASMVIAQVIYGGSCDSLENLMDVLRERAGILVVEKVTQRDESIRLERDDDGIAYYASVVISLQGDRARLVLARTWFEDQSAALQHATECLGLTDAQIRALPYEEDALKGHGFPEQWPGRWEYPR